MNRIERIKELNLLLQKASYAYYGKDNPVMSDKQYDELYDELSSLEQKTGCVLAGSPTQKVQGYVLDGFKKVKHSKPMLSANKTKEVKDIVKFVGNKDFYCSYKLDGLTLVVRFKEGKFVQGITRGNGIEGEDVTEQCKFIKNLPLTISSKQDIELRGECVISWEEFHRINSGLKEPYSHPRNLASGTLRNLDLNIVKERNLSFVVFEIVSPTFTHKLDGLKELEDFGFECVDRCTGQVKDCIKEMQPERYKYPVDGLIFELNNSELSKTLGNTAHHENCRIALKWADNLYETTLTDIEWNTSKTGLINPVAVFEPIELDGAIVSRATLHNLSYIEDLELGIGDIIQVYKANKIIPKVHDNLIRSNTWEIPDRCPCCGERTKIREDNGSKSLFCTNPDCKAQLISRLTHFVSKNAINIDGLSEQTIQKFVDLKWVESFQDIMNLNKYSAQMTRLEGFGAKSVNKLLQSIEKSKHTTFERFLYSLSIPLIGKTASKDISKVYQGDIKAFEHDLNSKNIYMKLKRIEGFGDTMCRSLITYFDNHMEEVKELAENFVFENNKAATSTEAQNLSGNTFCITGTLLQFKNRNELVAKIESLGGKVTGSVSSKTNYLINNDKESGSSKNKKALQLNIPIISEEDFISMIS